MIRYVLRPCWVAGLTWLIVSLACPWIPPDWRVGCIVLCAAVLTVSLCIPAVRRIHIIPLVAAVCLIATAAYQTAYLLRVKPSEACVGRPVSLQVQVMQIDNYVLLKVQEGELPKGTQLAFYPSWQDDVFEIYDRFTATFVLDTYDSGSELSQQMRRAYGTWLRVKTVDTKQIVETLMHGDAPWTDVFVRIRRFLVADIERFLDGDIGAVVAGICYGADDGLSDKAVSDFRACGVSHLFAVSGLHMTVLLQGVLYVLHRLRFKRVWRCVIASTVLLGFMAIVGFSASVVRAGVVCLVMLVGTCLRRRADSRNSLGIALLILLVPDPFAAYDVGLLLSFAATYGLLFWTGPIGWLLLLRRAPKRFAKLRRAAAGAVSLSMAAMLATLPVLALYFGQVSLMSVPANLLTTFSAEVVLIAGCLSSLFSLIGLSVFARPLCLLAGLMSRYLLWICQKFSSFSFTTVAISARFLLLWLIGVYVLLLLGRRVLSKQGLTALGGLCVCMLCIGLLLNRAIAYPTLRVRSASNKDELAVTVSYRGSTVVVTAPSSASSLYGIADALDAFSASHIDALFIIGGEEPGISYIPLVLKEFLTDDTQVFYSDLPWVSPLNGVSLENCCVRLGGSFQAQWEHDQLAVEWNTKTLLFTAGRDLIGTADAMFSIGQTPVAVRTDTGILPLAADNNHVEFKNERWYID